MQRLDTLEEANKDLLQQAVGYLEQNCKEPLQTVAAAARLATGEVVMAMNLYHFNGGPCAESVILANNLYKENSIEEIVAVHYDDAGTAEIINPCGRCRQMFNDYVPDITVIVGDGDTARTVTVDELLPFSYRNKALEYRRVAQDVDSEGAVV